MHIVRRQIIELKIKDPANAFFLQERAGKAYMELLLPLLDQYFNGISDNKQTVYRIEKLELNLGKISLQNFEDDLIKKIIEELGKRNIVFQKKKEAPIFDEEEPDYRDSDTQALQSLTSSESPQLSDMQEENAPGRWFELLSYFIRSGLLPWWADSDEESILDLALNKMIEQEPHQLESLLVYALKTPELIKRIIANFSESSLAQIGSILPGLPVSQVRGLPLQIETALGEQGRFSAAGKLPGHFTIWRAILSAFLVSSGRSLSREKLVEELLTDIYARNKIKLTASDREALKPKENDFAQHVKLLDITRAFLSLLENNPEYFSTSTREKEALQILLNEIEVDPFSTFTYVHSLQNIIGQVRVSESGNDKTRKNTTIKGSGTYGNQSKEEPDRIQQQLIDLEKKIREYEAGFNTGHHSKTIDFLPREKENKQILPEDISEAVFIKESIAPQGNYAMNSKDPFSEDEKITIENVGLVLLWPYLTRFFHNLDLVIEDKFISEPARHKAIHILQYLVDGEDETREYLLPLNKLLCGADIALIWEPQEEISAEEKEACEDLLSATIQNAPILNNMSIQGFRDTFLRRKGLLGTRDGVYLLQAERQTYDVVLDKVPWPFNLIKLPWMPLLLNVEW